MTREIGIDYKAGGYHFKDKNNEWIGTSEIYGRATPVPAWHQGVTREIDGKTWWLLMPYTPSTLKAPSTVLEFLLFDVDNTYIKNIKSVAPMILSEEDYFSLEQRAFFVLSDEEKKRFGTQEAWAVGVREDSVAWDVFYGSVDYGGKQMESVSVLGMKKRIEQYNKEHTNKPVPSQVKSGTKTRIKRLTNYSPNKMIAKINEIIEYLEGKHG